MLNNVEPAALQKTSTQLNQWALIKATASVHVSC